MFARSCLRAINKIVPCQRFSRPAECSQEPLPRKLISKFFSTNAETPPMMAESQPEEKKVKKVRIYTRTGDKGLSSLFDGTRKKKDDVIFEALGTIDELNAHLGVAYELSKQSSNGLAEYLEQLQSRLLDIGSHVATPADSANQQALERVKFDAKYVQVLEEWIDRLDEQLPPLRNFILPSGGLTAAQLHVARAVCRRAERCLVPLLDSSKIDSNVFIFLNRLSDFLFVSARYAPFL